MASFRWTPVGGSSEITFTLPRPMKFRDGSLGRARSRYRSVGLDQRTVVTELLTSSRADIVEGLIRFVQEPALLLKMIEDGADGALLTYTDDAGNTFAGLVLDEVGPLTEAEPDANRFGFGEWQRSLRLRQTTQEMLARLVPNFIPTALVGASANDYAVVDDDPALDATVDVEVRVAVALDDWEVQQGLAGKWTAGGGSGNPSWLFGTTNNSPAQLRFFWRDSTNTQFSISRTFSSSPAPGELVLVRAVLNANAGGGTSELSMFTKTGIAAADAYRELVRDPGWTQLGTTAVVATNADLQPNDRPVVIAGLNNGGQGPISGKMYGLILRSNQNIRLAIPFSDIIPGTTAYSERANGLTVRLVQVDDPPIRLELDPQ